MNDTHVDIPSLLVKSKLVAWLETKDPNGKYTYMDTQNCLFAQYLKENGVDTSSVGGYSFTVGSHNYDLPKKWVEMPNNNTKTFGEALKLAKRLPN